MSRLGVPLLIQQLRQRRRTLTRIAFWSLVESLPQAVFGLAVAGAIDAFLAGRLARGLACLALLLVAALVGAVAVARLIPCLAAVVEPVRDAFVAEVVEQTVHAASHSDRHPDATSVVAVSEQVEAVRNALSALLRTVRRTLFTFGAVVVGLALLVPPVALAVGLLTIVALGLFAWLLPALANRHQAVLLAEEELARTAGTAFDGLRDAIACGGAGRASAEVITAVDEQAAESRALARLSALRNATVFVGGQLPLLVLLATAPWLIRDGRLTIGDVAGAATYLTASLEPALRMLVGTVTGQGLPLVVNLRRLNRRESAPASTSDDTPSTMDHYDIVVRGLTFGYGPHSVPVVRELDLTIPEGAHLAIVGQSGIGKSTLANLLSGLLRPQAGTIRIGGRPVSQLRQLVGLIPQEAYVFAGTLRENLTYLAPHATPRELAAAIATVGTEPLVDRLGGLDAAVGADGVQLSQGERQLIALTRVYLSRASIVILDEATAHLDPVAEAVAEQAFRARGGTLVVIAHRITSGARADRILLLDNGSVHLGPHSELLTTCPHYAQLVEHWHPTDLPAPAESSR
jgi:ABC-type multidrug transport system fused ATPase/permease subunit